MDKKRQKEILKELVSFYDMYPEKRAMTRMGGMYSVEQNRCGVGMLIKDSDIGEFLDGRSIAWHFKNWGAEKFYSCFKPENANLPISFLQGIQALHDTDLFWYDYGITSEGQVVVKKIEYCIENDLWGDGCSTYLKS